MSALSLSIDAIRPLNRWDYDCIRPGIVGSVGDVLVSQRLKASAPGDFRWRPEYNGKHESLYGSAITNGTHLSYNSGGGPARCIDSNWGGRRSFRINHGWYYQDLRAPDKRIEPVVGETPQYSWRNKIATVNRAKTTGDLFPIPAGGLISPPTGNLTRGGNYPRVTDVVSADTTPGFGELNNGDFAASQLPNYKPSLSSFTAPSNDDNQRRQQFINGKSGTLGRMWR